MTRSRDFRREEDRMIAKLDGKQRMLTRQDFYQSSSGGWFLCDVARITSTRVQWRKLFGEWWPKLGMSGR